MARLVLKHHIVARFKEIKDRQIPRKAGKWHLGKDIYTDEEEDRTGTDTWFWTVCGKFLILNENADTSDIEDVKAKDVCQKCLGPMKAED